MHITIVNIVGARPQFIKAAAISRTLKATPDVEEILIYGADVSASRVALEGYLRGRWGTP